MRQTKLHTTIGFLLLLVGCSTNDNTTVCPSITAPEEGVRALVFSDDAEQQFDVRLNGVSAVCALDKSGNIKMVISIGLKLKRDLTVNAAADVVEIPILSATISETDQVIANQRLSSVAGIKKDEGLKYPVTEIEQLVPAGARLIISLAPSY
jgi:hypothetical protein